jgi:adenylate kinase family enzyme
VPLLGCDDPLPRRPARVLVAGTSGAGKTTLARRVAGVLQLPCVELDALFHGPGWTPRPDFAAEVQRFTATATWVTEWQYDAVRSLLAERADLLVWLDLPRAVVVRRVVLRTLVRRLRRQQLWNGNVEPPLRTFLTDPEHIVRESWTSHPAGAARVVALAQQRPELDLVRLSSRSEVERWVSGPLQDAARRPAP